MISGDVKNIYLLKLTYPKIKELSHKIGERTYKNMFAANPEIKELFKNTPPEQAQRLIETIIFYSKRIDNFKLIYDELDKIAHIHIEYGVKNEYYPCMKKAFINALCETLQVEETDELVSAWKYGFERLSYELIHIEDLIRKYSA